LPPDIRFINDVLYGSEAPEWDGTPSTFVFIGHSAGAHLVTLVGVDAAMASRLH